VVVAEADPAARQVEAVRVHDEVHRAFGANGAVAGCVPAHEDLVVPQSKLAAPVVAALLFGQAKGHCGYLQEVSLLPDVDLLRGDLLDTVSGRLPRCPPGPSRRGLPPCRAVCECTFELSRAPQDLLEPSDP
jgi:hypothetical protein